MELLCYTFFENLNLNMKIIAIALRNFKCYQATTIMPVAPKKENFIGYIGENGVGKSAILLGLHAFFTNSGWIKNKTGKKVTSVDCAVAPIVLCNVKDFDLYFLEDEERATLRQLSEKLRVKLLENKILDVAPTSDEILLSCIFSTLDGVGTFDGEAKQTDTEALGKKVRSFILDSLSYIYIDADVDIDEALGVNSQILNLIKGTGIVGEIEQQLKNITVGRGTLIDHINTIIVNYFDETVIQNLQKIDVGYNYKNLTTGAPSKLSEKQLAELSTQAIFYNRQLTKKYRGKDISLSDMSSGQRRSALLDFLLVVVESLDSEKKAKIILGLDEPEISVGASARIQQFEKLERVSKTINGVIFTTHWYGWVQQINTGSGVLIKESDDGREYQTFTMGDVFPITVSKPYEMRMMFDFLSSLGAWAENEVSSNFIICEGLTDYNLISKHFPEYKIIPVRSSGEVIRLYKIFHDYVWKTGDGNLANIVFLIDTDPDKAKDLPEKPEKNLKRISRSPQGKIEIVSEHKNLADKCEIEDLLSANAFLSALKNTSDVLLVEADKEFINGLSVVHENETGIRAFGLDDVRKLDFKRIYSGVFKLKVSEVYSPTNDEKDLFRTLLSVY